MRKLFLLYMLGGSVGFSSAFAQVGINTTEPKGVFHVDAKGNTQGNTNISDDVIVDSNGNLGIGTLTPQAKVHIYTDGTVPAIRISDQSEAAGSMLMFHDDTGMVNWVPKPFSIKRVETKDLRTDFVMNGRNSGDHVEITQPGKGLKLPPGIWMIMAKYMIYNHKGDQGNLFWTYLHDLDDLTGLSFDGTHLADKRKPCLIDGALPEKNCDDKGYNLNWYLASADLGANPSKSALTVVGIYPEAKPDSPGYTTPYVNYIAVIQSPGKNPGDTGYEHEIALTFSTSLKGEALLECKSSISEAGNNGGDLPVGVYFFAIRLDIDESSL